MSIRVSQGKYSTMHRLRSPGQVADFQMELSVRNLRTQEAWQMVLKERHDPCVDETDDKQHQEGECGVVFIRECIHHCDGEIDSQEQLQVWRISTFSPVFSGGEGGLPCRIDAIFRCSIKRSPDSQDRFHHGSGVAHREANPD